MASYHLHISEEPPILGKRIRQSLVFTVLLLVALLGFQHLEYGHWGPPIVWIVTGLICFLGGILWPTELQTFDFQIDDFGIRSFWNGKPFRRVRSVRSAMFVNGGIFGECSLSFLKKAHFQTPIHCQSRCANQALIQSRGIRSY